MQLPRKGILIRILIYGILLAIFLPPAVSRFFAEPEAKESVQQPAEPDLEGLDKKTIVGPDGKKMEYFELTPEEFEQRFGRPPPDQGPAFEPQKPAVPEAQPGEAKGIEGEAKVAGVDGEGKAGTPEAEKAPEPSEDANKPDPVENPDG